MMRIGIDLTALMPEATGVDTYLLQLVGSLAEVDQRNRYAIFVNREDRDRLPPLGENFDVIRSATRHRAVRLGWQQAALPIVAAARQLDVVHSPSFILPLADRRAKHVLSVHDLTSFSHPDTHIALRRSRPYRAAVLASIRRAQRICVPSVAVRGELVRLVRDVNADRVRVIPLGVSARFTPQPSEPARTRFGLSSPYALFVGTIQPRKNLEAMLEAYRQLVVNESIAEDLVIAGQPGWDYGQVLALANGPALRGRVHLLGYVDDSLLPSLYAGARVFVYPSLGEGFGLPPLEAMASGVPVVASCAPALTEHFAGAAELVPIDGADALAAAILRMLRDDELHGARRRQGLERARRFRWDNAARATLACYEELGAPGGQPAEHAKAA